MPQMASAKRKPTRPATARPRSSSRLPPFRPRTLDGLRVKARVYRDWIAPAQIQPGSELLPDRMLLGLLNDLAGA